MCLLQEYSGDIHPYLPPISLQSLHRETLPQHLWPPTIPCWYSFPRESSETSPGLSAYWARLGLHSYCNCLVSLGEHNTTTMSKKRITDFLYYPTHPPLLFLDFFFFLLLILLFSSSNLPWIEALVCVLISSFSEIEYLDGFCCPFSLPKKKGIYTNSITLTKASFTICFIWNHDFMWLEAQIIKAESCFAKMPR